MTAAEPTNADPAVAARYWEARARKFATVDAGRPAVLSYGMPSYYNRAIALCQARALAPWLPLAAGGRALDVGCGVGRWSLELARLGADVTGVDLSETMVARASERAQERNLSEHCTFSVADAAEVDLGGGFDFVLSVTVLQHILDPTRFEDAIERLADQLVPGGRMVLLEVAPAQHDARCDTGVFTARTLADHRRALARAGLVVDAVEGVDPMPLRRWVLPSYRRMPTAVGHAVLATTTALSLPVDWLTARRAASRSWHQVIVARKPGG